MLGDILKGDHDDLQESDFQVCQTATPPHAIFVAPSLRRNRKPVRDGTAPDGARPRRPAPGRPGPGRRPPWKIRTGGPVPELGSDRPGRGNNPPAPSVVTDQ
nr:hypothetical protein GCM10020093_040980 [Planobispora longispora]